MSKPSFKKRNERRAELIDKELTSGLTEGETAELAKLTAWCTAWVDERHPVPLEDMGWLERRVAELEAAGEHARREGGEG